MIYNKLIRDRIPEIIQQSGKKYEVAVLPDDEYLEYLYRKLDEELSEFQNGKDIEELADLEEVLLSILKARGVSEEEFEAIRLTKREARGGFEKKLLLKEVR